MKQQPIEKFKTNDPLWNATNETLEERNAFYGALLDITKIRLEPGYCIPVCTSWYGCDKHPREACMFQQARKFGLIPVCVYLGQDCNNEPDVVNRVLDECPLHKEDICKN